MTIRYTTLMTLVVERPIRIELVAIAYHLNQKGLYSRPAKAFIKKGIDDYIAGLTPSERVNFDQILTNVQMLADEGEIKGIQSLEEFNKRIQKRQRKTRR